MSVVIWLPLPKPNADVMALSSDRSLMRCAAQSAWMSVAGTPHTFSV